VAVVERADRLGIAPASSQRLGIGQLDAHGT
jgi:hypothetical protein